MVIVFSCFDVFITWYISRYMDQRSPLDRIMGVSNKWVFAVSTLLFISTIAILPSLQGTMIEDGGSESPDLSLYYSAEDLYRMAENYGAEGRSDYIRMRFTFDLIFPLIYGGFLFSGTGWLFNPESQESRRWKINTLPLLGVLFDYLENIATSIVMWRYPIRTPILDTAATIFTPVKWVIISICFILILVGLIRLLIKRLR